MLQRACINKMNGWRMLEREVLSWEALKGGAGLGPIKQRLESKTNKDLSDDQVMKALNSLAAQELLEKSGNEWRLSEPDRDELSLYPLLIKRLQSRNALSWLGVQEDSCVLQDTSAIAGSEGRYSRPDITLAAVRTWKYDPKSTLEVYSFEVKNRKGSNVPAVYEALAHARFVNHPYLVIPRTKLDNENAERIRKTCEREGVGLICFDLRAASIDPGFDITDLSLEVEAERRPTNPRIIEDFLDARLETSAKTKLVRIARGAKE